ncbi:hypothetical protein NDU88_005375 [Pleurodeles waltl]|uniref:Uncharacterized protein n=1 Tax=Pleurodeles waltl TaxID=8319 RepID=A0AAV7MB14_PLEWA|nr:hypothetical protein NDU88_005375 [Pleurodeles waltl]
MLNLRLRLDLTSRLNSGVGALNAKGGREGRGPARTLVLCAFRRALPADPSAPHECTRGGSPFHALPFFCSPFRNGRETYERENRNGPEDD